MLKQVNGFEWGAPFPPQPKEGINNDIFLSDFGDLNRQLERKPCLMPKVGEILLKFEGFKYATSLDLNMGYYHICLSEEEISLCIIILPWGKYQYKRLPMGTSNSPDIFQEKMNKMFHGFQFI